MKPQVISALVLVLAVAGPAFAQEAATDRPNILVIFGDDIGIANVSAYSDGLMGYTTPNIDRIADEGIRFLHYYGEQSCTAGRAAFLTGQHGLRTGLTKVGFPGAPMGLSQLDPTIGVVMQDLGYATGQFGKNHVGDRNETLPTVNGFDEFFGNLYHLNAEEEPFGPRGVLHTYATDVVDETADPRFGVVGKQTIEDTGPLTRKRMETIDDETSAAAIDPYGDSEYLDGMIEHDATVGELLSALDAMGIADDTIVLYTSDNGPHMNTWPDGAMTPFRSEKNTNWEGAFRVPMLARWPGHIAPGTVTVELMSHNDWMPTLAAIAGRPTLVEDLRAGATLNGVDYKVHLDGYDQSEFLTTVTGTVGTSNGVRSARDIFWYADDDMQLVGLRKGPYKYVFEEQRKEGTMGVWAEPFTRLRLQKIFNLMQDPYERADITSNTYWDWHLDHVGTFYGITEDVFAFAATFDEFPPRSFPPSFNPADVFAEKMRLIRAERTLREAFPMLPEHLTGPGD